jgi:enamine deaminase RidA (YjgF/YER057c/UK114 family)
MDTASVDAALARLGYRLPVKPPSASPFVGAVRSGSLLFVGGHGPLKEGQFVTGKLGRDLTVQEGQEAARLALVNALATVNKEVGDLSQMKRIVKLLGMVNADESFVQHTEVVNGASDLLLELFGDRGRHTRSAVGMGSLPRNIAVELELIVEVA